MQQHFLIEGKYLGSVERGFDLTRGALPYGVAYFCSECAELWAKFPVEGRFTQVYSTLCRKHHTDYPQFHLPGSIWLSWEKELMAALPAPVLLWELQRELDMFERIKNEHP